MTLDKKIQELNHQKTTTTEQVHQAKVDTIDSKSRSLFEDYGNKH